MKKLIACLFIAISVTVSFSSYAAESHDNSSGLEEHFNPLFWHPNPDNPQLPLPYLPTREEIEAQRSAQKEREKRKRTRKEDTQKITEEQQYKRACLRPNEQDPTSSTTSSASSSLIGSEQAAGESPLEQLPLELFKHITQRIPLQHSRAALALASTSLRDRSQAVARHIAIPIGDITKEILTSLVNKFKSVTNVTIYSSSTWEETLTPEKITLLASKFPHITSLNLSNTNMKKAGMATLAQAFKHLLSLNLSFNPQIGDAGIAELIRAPFIHILESLNLEKTGITPDGVISLATPGKLTALKELNLASNQKIGDAGITELVRAPFVHILESLNLRNTGITSDGVISLAIPDKLVALKNLNLAYTKIGDAGIAELIRAPFVHTLESLNLQNTGITFTGVETLAIPDKLIDLKKLNLRYNNSIGNAGITELIKAPFVHTLESLDLQDTGITSAGVATLATPGKFITLKKLSLSFNPQIGDAGITELIKAPFVHTLESLNLGKTGITPDGVISLATPGKLTALKELNLASNQKIGDAGITELVRAPFVHILESLDLRGTGITSTGVKLLAIPGRLAALKDLDLGNNWQIGDAGIAELTRAPFAHTLESLALFYVDITDKGVELLTLPNVFMSLRMLNLTLNVRIQDMSVDKLLTAPFAGKLYSLNIFGTNIKETAQKRLVEERIARYIDLYPPSKF